MTTDPQPADAVLPCSLCQAPVNVPEWLMPTAQAHGVLCADCALSASAAATARAMQPKRQQTTPARMPYKD